MKTAWNSFQAVLSAMGGWLGWFMGGCDGFLYALVAFTVIDYVTGLMCAVIDRSVSSEVGLRGIFKKVMIFALVGVGHTIDQNIIHDGSVIRTAVIFFFVSNEGLSLLENAGRIGLPVPERLKEVLSQLHGNKYKTKETEDDKHDA